MTLPIPVACWVNDAGTWRKTKPWANNGSGWPEIDQVYAKAASTWQTSWVAAGRAINTSGGNVTLFSLDLSDPFNAGAGYRYNTDGSTSYFTIPSPSSFTTHSKSWLKYDVGTFAGQTYAFDIKFVDNGSHNLDTVPALGSFLALASGPYLFQSNLVLEGSEDGIFSVSLIDNNAPGPAPILHSYTLRIDVDAEGLG